MYGSGYTTEPKFFQSILANLNTFYKDVLEKVEDKVLRAKTKNPRSTDPNYYQDKTGTILLYLALRNKRILKG